MILGPDRLRVIGNIRSNFERGDFHAKAEFSDPVLSPEESQKVLDKFVAGRKSLLFPLKNLAADLMIGVGEKFICNMHTRIVGQEKLKGLQGGAILTSNHFSQFDNCVLRHFAIKQGKRRLYVVSQLGNLLLPGLLGFLLTNTDLIPIASDSFYLRNFFEPEMHKALDKGGYVLIYPEQEMWWGWRRPRSCKRGAYYYACLFDKPVVSCFVEIRDEKRMDKVPFHKVRYTLHLLGVLYPPEGASPREASVRMAEADYQMKKAAYENIYGKPIDAPFSSDDIAGWDGSVL